MCLMPLHMLCGSLLEKWLWIFWVYAALALLMPVDTSLLASLSAAESPDLNASSQASSRDRVSAFIQGLWLR